MPTRVVSDASLAEKLLVHLLEPRAHLRGRYDRTQSIVLVGRGDAESCYDRIADELLDGAAMALEDGAHFDEVALHDATESFGVEALAKLGRARDIGENDRDELAHLAHAPSVRLGESGL
jgi:hypothetical protein